MSHLAFFTGLVASAACLALVEIQIEGPHGWAAQLPTWRLRSPWIERIFPGRPLTGYHLWILTFVAIVAHLPYAFGLPWSWPYEARSAAFILMFWVLEDFLWFVLNPHYGLRRFRPQYIPWHRASWWWIAPRDYWIATVAALVLYALSHQTAPVIVAMNR